MNDLLEYDYIFAGFGLSGMSLLLEMSRYAEFREKKVLIIDQSNKRENDRTWSFWSNELFGLEQVIRKSWKKGHVYNREGEKIDLGLSNYQYHTVGGLDYYNYIREQLRGLDNLTFVQDKILKTHEQGLVECAKSRYHGKQIFVSYFEREEIDTGLANVFLWQHFKGWQISVDQPVFDANDFLMMDYRSSDGKQTDFFYVLPFNSKTALVEFTEFSNSFYSQEQYDFKLKTYIQNQLNIQQFDIQHDEFNAIPMSDYQIKNPIQGKLIYIGTMAGYVKASTGYSFSRTIKKNRLLAKSIMENQFLRQLPSSPSSKYRKYDSVLLDVIANRGVSGAELFPRLFAKLGGDFMFKFLDEDSNLLEDLRVMMAVPHQMKFIKSFLAI